MFRVLSDQDRSLFPLGRQTDLFHPPRDRLTLIIINDYPWLLTGRSVNKIESKENTCRRVEITVTNSAQVAWVASGNWNLIESKTLSFFFINPPEDYVP